LGELKITKRGVFKVSDPFSDDEYNETICTWIESEKVKNVFRKKIEEEILNPSKIYTKKDLQELSWKYEMIN